MTSFIPPKFPSPVVATHFLFVCDQYPPVDQGGYAQLCFDLAAGLRRKGHTVSILTHQTQGLEDSQNGEAVYRELQAPIDFAATRPVPLQQITWEKKRRLANQKMLRHWLNHTKAQVVLFWPNLQLDRSLMSMAEETPDLITAYYIAGVSPLDPSPIDCYWQGAPHSRSARLLRKMLSPFVPHREQDWQLTLPNVLCVSDYERDRVIRQGIPAPNAHLCRNGIDIHQFAWMGLPSARRLPNQPLRVLYMGRLVATKGAHLVMEAIAQTDSVTLTILGTGDEGYRAQLVEQANRDGIRGRVIFESWKDRAQVPAFMRQFDVLVLPTIHPEPLARAVQEAMAMGLVVIATNTGGTPEIVRDGETGLLFDPNHPEQLTAHLRALAQNPARADSLARAARQLVLDTFNIETMFAQVEAFFARRLSPDSHA